VTSPTVTSPIIDAPYALSYSPMTSRDYMTSYSWRHSIQSRCILKLGTPSTIRVEPLSKP